MKTLLAVIALFYLVGCGERLSRCIYRCDESYENCIELKADECRLENQTCKNMCLKAWRPESQEQVCKVKAEN